MTRFLFALFMFSGVMLAQAEEIVLGMSQNEVAITATFDGSNILVFGAIKRDSPIPKVPLHVIVSITGPSKPVVVRRKAQHFGIWLNKDMVEVDAAPSFYAIATTGSFFREVLSETEDLQHNVSINRAISLAGAPKNTPNAQNFTDALIRIRREQGLYQSLEGTVALDQQTLFRTTIKMPASLTEGEYKTRIFLTREGRVLNKFETSIDVRKVGLERFLFKLSRDSPLTYGLLSIAIAIMAGWLASAFFQVIRSR